MYTWFNRLLRIYLRNGINYLNHLKCICILLSVKRNRESDNKKSSQSNGKENII